MCAGLYGRTQDTDPFCFIVRSARATGRLPGIICLDGTDECCGRHEPARRLTAKRKKTGTVIAITVGFGKSSGRPNVIEMLRRGYSIEVRGGHVHLRVEQGLGLR
jgi:hypothetical protein